MRDFQTVQNQTYDVIVIGGGINGAGVARDAALRGLKTLLIEKHDFSGGTTSWSSRLVHGGVRYLEYLEFNLVRESLRERELLLRAAPHLIKSIQMTIPIYADGQRNYWEIQIGMFLYDLLSLDKTLPSHRMLPKPLFQQLFRAVNSDRLVGAAQYYDAQVEYAERLCLETLISAREAGATILNYVKATHLCREQDVVAAIACQDQLTGLEFTLNNLHQTIVVNTSGPWVDQVCRSAQRDGMPEPMGQVPKIGGTKGSHIIVDPFPGAPNGAFYVEARTDGRPFFIISWVGLYLIGTTDLRYQGDLDRIKADDDEIDYLIRETNRVIPSAHLTREHVRFTYSGVRPLPYTQEQKPGSITRRHVIIDHTPDGGQNFMSLIGGKLTTYRQVGEEIVDVVFRKLNRLAPKSPTLTQLLPGAILPNDPRIAEAIATYSPQIDRNSIDYLFSIYGARAIEVLALTQSATDLAEPIVPSLPEIKAQVVYAVQAEMAETLEDICCRRTTLAMRCKYGFEVLPVITEILMRHCGWTREQCDRQIQLYHAYIQTNCLPDYAIALYPEKSHPSNRQMDAEPNLSEVF